VSGAPDHLLELRGISRHYRSGDTVVRALDDVSLTVDRGEFVAIMGQSGSGKTTLMNLLGCLDSPTAGSYRIEGQEAADLEADELATLRRKTFGFIFQRYNLLATASAEENVEIPAIYAGLEKARRRDRARELLGKLGLGARGGHLPSQLSGGQQQRVAIARALMNNPAIILADEPTGALDSRSGQEVMTLLHELHREGRTIILITHDEKVAENAKRIIRVQDGKILSDAPNGAEEKSAALATPALEGDASGALADISEATKTALRSLRVNLFRTALTLLGIIIGVAAVVTMLAIGNGSKAKVVAQISAMGTNLLNIRPGGADIRNSGDNATLLPADALALLDAANVEAVVPERDGRATLRFGSTDYASQIQGVGSAFPSARDWPVAQGTFFTDRDVEAYAPVIVLGKTVADTLFKNGEAPVGQYVLVKNIPFQVIGVMASKGAAPWGGDQDDAAFVPYTTGMIRLFGGNYLNSVTVKVADVGQIDATQQAITALLKARHNGIENFRIRNTASLLDMVSETQNTLTVLLGAVAAISLLVGGIGVMNIMLVSVTERTREIGIRMATGARRRDIMLQFNTEAAVVCTVGGILGILAGFLAGWIISLFDVSVMFSVMPALLAFSCAVATGLLFGYLPARKAAWLDPVVALSSE
jgi:macrolide transport system ATP-binding/permease protein